ncbi:MAG: NAD-dependent epimerase/dehydratase family protein [Bacteriovorax sp.]
MKVLVTGANGFLGHHLIKKLLTLNFEVTALVRANSDFANLSGLNVEIVHGDILDYEGLKKAAKNVDGIYHVAGFMTASPKERDLLFKVNVDGVKNIIRLCREEKIKKLVHVSSVVAVGSNLKKSDPLLNEESLNLTVGRGLANYDSKRMGEELVLAAARMGEIRASVVNPGLIYGAGDAKKIVRKGNVLAARGRLPFYTDGGVNIVSVGDVVFGMIRAMEVGRNGERYLLTGDNITIKELLTSIATLAGSSPPFLKLSSRLLKILSSIHDFLGLKGELSRENIFSATSFHWYDHQKAERELHFHPRSYREAISESVEWMKEHQLLEKQ